MEFSVCSSDLYDYRQALIRNPTDMVTNQDGSWIERDGFNYDNPVSRINETHSDVEAREFRLNGMLSFDPIENVRLSVLASTMAYNSQDGYARTLQHAANVIGGEGEIGRASCRERVK